MFPYLIFDGLANPMSPIEVFLGFEFLTLLIEGLILFMMKPVDKPLSDKRAFLILIIMNSCSAFFAIPFWLYYDLGA